MNPPYSRHFPDPFSAVGLKYRHVPQDRAGRDAARSRGGVFAAAPPVSASRRLESRGAATPESVPSDPDRLRGRRRLPNAVGPGLRG